MNRNVVDSNDDANIDSTGTTPDYWQNQSFEYTGWVVTIGGNDFAVFDDPASSNTFWIPFDPAVQDISGAFGATTGMQSGVPGSLPAEQQENTVPANFCFLDGTRIATPSGEALVEDLQIGDLVRTADGRNVPVKWIGRQHIARPANIAHDGRLAPVCIAAGALGNHSDLYVSADHGMVVEGYVINASALVNGDTIRFVPSAEMRADFTYYHIETEAHDAIFANGAPAETFIDAASRAGFDNHAEYLALYGAERIIPEMPLTRISSQRVLPAALQAHLGLDRAGSADRARA